MADGDTYKKQTADRLTYIFTVAICIIAALVCCYLKQGMHEDEFYSYYSSNRTAGFYADGYVTRDAILDELTVRAGEGFNFSLVKEVQSWDVHPPVYYFLIHSVCSLTPGVFNKWQGLIINLACLVICLILMKQIGNILLGEKRIVVNALILAWGVSAAALTVVVFIRMYMLLTVWILAVTLLHILPSARDEGSLKPIFWIALGVLTFLGFMTHYYFFIWLFFLAVFWNIREVIRIKSIRSSLIYLAVMVVSFGLCYLFYPAFPAQMFRGQRGAQATGNFLDIGNTWERIRFFADKVNRIGFGGILWVIAGILFIMYLLVLDKKRGLSPRIASWSAGGPSKRTVYSPVKLEEDPALYDLIGDPSLHQDRPGQNKTAISDGCGSPVSDAKMLFGASLGYFLIVSKTALMLGDSSIRYQMPVLGIVYLCIGLAVAALMTQITDALTYNGDRSGLYSTVAVLVFICILIIFNVISCMRGGISFLYPETSAHREMLASYPDAEVIYIYPPGQSWIIWAEMDELLDLDGLRCISTEEIGSIYDTLERPLIIYADKGYALPEGTILYDDEYCNVYLVE